MLKKYLNHFWLLLPIVFCLWLLGYSDYALEKSHTEVVKFEAKYREEVITNWFNQMKAFWADESLFLNTLIWYSSRLDNRQGIYSRVYWIEDRAEVNSDVYKDNDRTDIKMLETSKVLFEYERAFPEENPEFLMYFALSPQYYNTQWVVETQDRITFALSLIMVLYLITWLVHLRKNH